MPRDGRADEAGSEGGIALHDLCKRYGPVAAVDRVSLDVRPGEFLALLGPSGSGKTTILMCIAGFEYPDSGSIRIGGQDVTWTAPNRRGLGMVFQRYTLFPHMSVLENVAFPLKMRGVGRTERDARARAALDTVRLSGLGDRRPAQLSGGQQQRVALARAVVYRPRVLLMDEPLSALDKNLREEMQGEIKRLQRALGVTVVFVTHDQGEALTMADRVAVLDGGRLQQLGTPRALYEAPDTEFVAGFVGETNFLPGVASTGAAPGEALAVTLDGADNTVVQATAVAATAPGAKIRVAVRPEQIRLAGPGPAATVEEATYAGTATTVLLRLSGGGTVRARLPAGTGAAVPAAGTAVSLGWQPGAARAFLGTP